MKRVKKISLGRRYIQGRRYEYQAIKKLKSLGFQIIIRSARSYGIFDVLAIKGDKRTRKVKEIKCIQVKATVSKLPFKSVFLKNDREEFLNSKSVPIIAKNIFYEIWIWRIRKGWNIYRLNWKTREFDKI